MWADPPNQVEEGKSGLLVTRGSNLMTGYANDETATAKAIHSKAGGWYVNLGDVCFWLRSISDGGKDIYWQSRESSLLIRGGANYAYDQVNEELTAWVAATYDLQPGRDFILAVVGLRLRSEHDDDCCVTIELTPAFTSSSVFAAAESKARIRASFLKDAKSKVSKGAAPDRLRFGSVPRNFKGAVLTKDLSAAWKACNGKDDATTEVSDFNVLAKKSRVE